MKRIAIIFYVVTVTLLCIAVSLASTILKYDRTAAKMYAERHCSTNDYNEAEYRDFPNDCTNFASQVLIAGGLSFENLELFQIVNRYGNVDYQPVNIAADGKPRIKGLNVADAMPDTLVNKYCAKIIVNKVNLQDISNGTISIPLGKKGDIVAFWNYKRDSDGNIIGGRYEHVGVLDADGNVYAHSNSHCGDVDITDFANGFDAVTIIHIPYEDDPCKVYDNTNNPRINRCEPQPKCSPCEICDTETAMCKPKCSTPSGRCTPSVPCRLVIEDGIINGVCQTSPGGDCPDDTLTVGTGTTPQAIPRTIYNASIGILENGYTYDMLKLLSSFGEIARVISISDLSPELAKEMPLLIIPTAGLNGMDNSSFFKLVLEEYVKQGGTILVLTQQYGSEFSVIPGGLAGYGWAEDQSCQANSSYIDTWHPVLSGQTRSTPSLNIDGYFTKYPENTDVLLRRTANGQPSLILYPYANGYVIASSVYADFAYSTGQSSDEERKLVRDIITWAKKPDTLMEVHPGDTANLNLQVTNTSDDATATSAYIEIHDPDRTKLQSYSYIPVNIAPDATGQISFIFPTISITPLGIWHVKYTLAGEGMSRFDAPDDASEVPYTFPVQLAIEPPSGRFIVSSPPSSQYENPDFNFSIQSDDEYYFYGSSVTYTVNVWNNTDSDSNLTLKYALTDTGRGGVYKRGAYAFTSPAGAATSFNITSPDISGRAWMRGWLYNETGNPLGYAIKIVRAVYPTAAIFVSSDKNSYYRNEQVTTTASLHNTSFMKSSYQANLKVSVMDPSNTKIFEDTKTLNLSPSGTSSIVSSFTLPAIAAIGTYTVKAEVYYGTQLISSASTKFELPQSQISVMPNLLSAFIEGTNTIPFVLNNTGKMSVSSGILNVSLTDPEGTVVYSGSQQFALATGQNMTLNIPVTIPPLKFGNYKLTYAQSDETRTGQPNTVTIPNIYSLSISADKPLYKIGETANITISLNNTGKFRQNGALTINAQFLEYNETRAISAGPSEHINIPLNLQLPVTLNSGGDLNITFTTQEGNQLAKTLSISIAGVGIGQNVVFDKPSYRIRETLGMNFTLTNNSDFASALDVSLSLTIPDINYAHNSTVSIEPGMASEMQFNIPIPESLTAGYHYVLTSITLPSGIVHPANFSFTIPESAIEIASPSLSMTGQTSLTAGDTINLYIDNTGGVDTDYTTEKLVITDSKGITIFQGNVTDVILAGEKKTLTDIQIPSQTANGFVFLNIQIKDSKASKRTYLYKTLEITGLTATLEMRTDKDAYLKTEAITGLSSIANGQFGVENGSLKVTVSKINSDVKGHFSHFLPKDGSLSFSSPYGVAVGIDGSIYVTDTNNHRIQKFSENGDMLTQWGSYGNVWYGGGDGQFNYPMGIAIGSDGSVYVADADNCRIQKFDSNGNFITKWGSYGSNNGQFNYPRGVAISSDGSIYVADTKNHRIQKFDSNGNFISTLGTQGSFPGQFKTPYGVAVAPDGSVYVADTGNWRFQKFDGSGNFIYFQYEMVDNRTIYPWGIAVGPDGSVYLSDYGSDRILKYDSGGNLISKWGKLGVGDGEFYRPSGVAIGSDGSVYVADTSNHRIQKMTSTGGGIDKLFETTIPIIQPANTTQDYTTNVGTLNTTGKLYLQAELKNNLGQTIATSEYPFYIIEGDTVLSFNTDKKYYKPNETVTITGEVKNPAAITATALSLQLSANSQNIYTANFDLPANGSYPFTITTTASTEGSYILTGKVTQNNSTLVEINDRYEVVQPKVSVSVTVSEVVGNEPFDINVEMKNEGKVNAALQLLVLSSQFSDTQQITIPSGETKTIQYSQQITGDTTYTFTFTGDLEQTIQKTVLFGKKAELNLDIQAAYKEGAVTIPYAVKNTGVLEAAYPVTFTLLKGEQEISKTTANFMLPVSGSASGSLSYNLSEGLYTLRSETTGFVSESLINVIKPGQGAVTLSVNDTYAEGLINIPYTVSNTGQLDSEFVVGLNLDSISTTKSFFIPAGETHIDTIQYQLAAGDHVLIAQIASYPSLPVSKNFKVLRENSVTMDVTIGTQTNDLIPVTVNLTNLGYNEINGSIQLSAISSQGTEVWSSEQAVTQLLTSNSQLITFNINPAGITPGDYTLKSELLNNSNQQIAVSNQQLAISGPIFQITQLPSYQTFTVGEEASFIFKVKNTGNQEGGVNLNLKSYDLIDLAQTEWLKPGEEKEMSFGFMLPEDIEEKDYYADYELGDSPDSTAFQAGKSGTVPTTGQIKYHVAGINLNVNAALDKQNYSEGETAHLTIAVSSQQSAVSLFARVNYNGYENQQSFTLNGSQTLTFDIPLTEISGEKLFYGIYHESGRSIHLNSLYIYKAGDTITITTDKQVYEPGEQVSVTVNSVSGITGTMTLNAPNYEETFDFTGIATKSFALPSLMTAGTYNISAQLSAISGETYTASHPFDVNGIQVKVLECKNDKGKYASSDTIATSLTISSNITMPATLKTWIVDPEGNYMETGETPVLLTSSENLLAAIHSSLSTNVSGIHRLLYGIYTEGQTQESAPTLLVSGSEAFDVGDAVLLGLSTDKTDYPTNTEPVNVTASMFGTIAANLELQLDGTIIKSESVSLNGFETWNLGLETVNPGVHILRGILTASGLTSTKETSFVYGSNLPDLTAVISSQQSAISKENTIEIKATAMNQGKTPADAATIALYDNDFLLETKPVTSLNSGESQEITFVWNVFGKAGEHVIKAVADPENSVIEFNEDNNTSTTNILIPDVNLVTETDKDIYKIRQGVNITSNITNLTSAKTYQNLTLTTSAKDPSGAEVYSSSKIIEIIQPSTSLTNDETWDTSSLNIGGTYTITQSITSATEIIAQSSKLIALEKAPDFTLSVNNDYLKIKQGEKANYTAYLGPLNGWTSEITLNVEGLPTGSSVSFSPGNLIPPGESLTVIITTDATSTGTHSLTLKAEGVDEGEIVSHTQPLTLDVSGFELSAEPSSKTIKQLETAVFNINVNALNGYEGEVSLSVSGMPYGIKASFSSTNIQVPGNAALTILASKYVRPGTYDLAVTGDDGLVKHNVNIGLVIESNPEIASGIITTKGPGANNDSLVRIFNSEMQPVQGITAFDTKYGAYAVGADIDGDGYDEIIVSQGPDPKNSATLRVFNRNGDFITEYTAFDTKYGLTLSSGDIDGDWKDELIVGIGPDPKNPATLKILKHNGAGFDELMTQTVFDTKYGVNTAAGDINGDGMHEIIIAPGPGPNNPAIAAIFKYEGQTLIKINTITAFDGSYGANIATGDIDGDGITEIIFGTGPDPKDPAIVRAYKSDGTLLREITPYDCGYGYGVIVASGDINGDGIDDIITGLGPGPQNPSWVKVFKSDGTEAGVIVFPDIKYGVRVSRGNIGN